MMQIHDIVCNHNGYYEVIKVLKRTLHLKRLAAQDKFQDEKGYWHAIPFPILKRQFPKNYTKIEVDNHINALRKVA